MFKKLLIAALAVLVGVAVVSGTRWGGYLRCMGTKAEQWAKDQVPLESEIARLKMEVANLVRDDDRYYDQVAHQQREVVKLREKVKKSREALTAQEKFIHELQATLTQDRELVVFNGTEYPRSRVIDDVKSERRRFLADEKIVQADEKNLAILEETLAKNKEQLDNLALRRKQMEAELLVLERDLAQQRLKAQNTLVVDDGRYGKVGKDIEELRERIALKKAKADLRGEVQHGSIRAEQEKKAQFREVDKEADARFGPIQPNNKVVKE